jgi:hypothetical protein
MKHPDLKLLALLSGGDLGAWSRWRVERHVRACQQCRREMATFRTAGEQLRRMEELPADLDWGGLALEMKANIRVGLAAGQCVDSTEAPRRAMGWKPALVLAGLAVIVVSGLILNLPQPKGEQAKLTPAPVAAQQGVLAQTTSLGIELQENGRVLTILHRADEPAVVSASADGSVRARYVDSATGQVTITNVYTE